MLLLHLQRFIDAKAILLKSTILNFTIVLRDVHFVLIILLLTNGISTWRVFTYVIDLIQRDDATCTMENEDDGIRDIITWCLPTVKVNGVGTS